MEEERIRYIHAQASPQQLAERWGDSGSDVDSQHKSQLADDLFVGVDAQRLYVCRMGDERKCDERDLF